MKQRPPYIEPRLNRFVRAFSYSIINFFFRSRLVFPESERQKLAAAHKDGDCTTFAPNHSWFLLDWMADLLITYSVAPQCAYWAAASIMNGQGALGRWFWSRNGLIPASSNDPEAAEKFAIEHIRKGAAVLGHVEGTVSWFSHDIATLRTGMVRQSIEAHKLDRAEGNKRKHSIVPIVWRVVVPKSTEKTYLRVCRSVYEQVGQKLYPGHDLYGAVYALYDITLHNEGVAAGVSVGHEWPLEKKFEVLKQHDATKLSHCYLPAQEDATTEELVQALERFRQTYLKKGWRNTLHNLAPLPKGHYEVHIRVADPIVLSSGDSISTVEDVVGQVKAAMKQRLNELNAEVVR